jgi:hypothetical protein
MFHAYSNHGKRSVCSCNGDPLPDEAKSRRNTSRWRKNNALWVSQTCSNRILRVFHHGLTPLVDKEQSRKYNIIIVGPPLHPEHPLRLAVL